MESEFYVTLPNNSSVQYFPDNKTSNFVTKLSRTLQLHGEWEVSLAEIDYPHTWYDICEGKNSVEIYAPDKFHLVFKIVEYSIQPGYYEKVQDVTDALYKAGLPKLTDVVLPYDDTSKRVTVKCGKRVVVKLRGIEQGCLVSLMILLLELLTRKVLPLPYPELEINIFTFIQISSRVNIMVMLLFPFFVLLQ